MGALPLSEVGRGWYSSTALHQATDDATSCPSSRSCCAAAFRSPVVEPVTNTRKVFDLTLPFDQAADGYRAMDERRAIKTLLTV